MKPKIICSECSSELSKKDRFCPSCGVKIQWDDETQPAAAPQPPLQESATEARHECDVCGFSNVATALFCESCGARLEGARISGTPEKFQKKSDKTSQKRQKHNVRTTHVSSGKFISIAAAIILVGFALYIFVIDRDRPHAQQPVSGMVGGEMERMIWQEIERLEHELRNHDPENAQLMLRLANLYHDIRQFDNAIRYYNEYIKRNPEDPDVRVDLGICYFEAGQRDRAVSTVTEVTREFPEHQLAAFNLGIIYLNMGDIDSANRYFRRAHEINPDNETGRRAKRIIDEHTF